ncbi:hypothetical protein L2E82_51798 [Cichorium intybus]|nr:hypothetical protein L2E82_51798 [Cichorium intybus]
MGKHVMRNREETAKDDDFLGKGMRNPDFVRKLVEHGRKEDLREAIRRWGKSGPGLKFSLDQFRVQC